MLPEKKQVLIVDDEPNLRKILAAQLSRDGYDVMTAEDGEQGLAALRDHHIDLVVTDLKMPRMDGMELLSRIGELPQKMAVVMLTAQGSIESAVEAMRMGAYDYITKPFKVDELQLSIQRALDHQHDRREIRNLRQIDGVDQGEAGQRAGDDGEQDENE